MTTELMASLLAATAALVGALGSQALSARRDLRIKKLEFQFQRKADAYERVLETIGPFAMAPGDELKYQAFIAALDRAALFASGDVYEALCGPGGLNTGAQRMRMAAEANKTNGQEGQFFDAINAVGKAMRSELEVLSSTN